MTHFGHGHAQHSMVGWNRKTNFNGQQTALGHQNMRILFDRDIDEVPLEAFFVALRRYLVDDANGNAEALIAIRDQCDLKIQL